MSDTESYLWAAVCILLWLCYFFGAGYFHRRRMHIIWKDAYDDLEKRFYQALEIKSESEIICRDIVKSHIAKHSTARVKAKTHIH